MADPNDPRLYSASLTVKSNVALISDMLARLNPARTSLLRASCFGRWLQLTDISSDPILVLMFLQCQIFPPTLRDNEIVFQIGGRNLRFNRKHFCLITGLRFGATPVVNRHPNGFVRRVFHHSSITVKDLRHVYGTIGGSNDRFTDDEAVRICLLMMAETFFLGHQSATKVPELLLDLIEELASWNNFPWGSYIWDYTFRQMNGAFVKKRTSRSPKPTMNGFLFALKGVSEAAYNTPMPTHFSPPPPPQPSHFSPPPTHFTPPPPSPQPSHFSPPPPSPRQWQLSPPPSQLMPPPPQPPQAPSSGFDFFVDDLFRDPTTGPSFTQMMDSSTSAFHTPTSTTVQIPPEEPLGRGLRERWPAAVHGPPYTQQGSTTPLPKKTKAMVKGPAKRKAGTDVPESLAAGVQPTRESLVCAKYHTNELPMNQRLRVLPHEIIGPVWWKALLGLDREGWFLNTHIEAWLRYLLQSHRRQEDQWTIMVPDFWDYMSNRGLAAPASYGYGCAIGSLSNEGFPAWSNVSRVFIPICIDEKHWVLGILNLNSMKMTVHDTLGVDHLRQSLFEDFAIFLHNLKDLFLRLGDMSRANRASEVEITFAEDTPRQSGHLGDCGPWVCRFLSQFTGAMTVPPVRDTAQDMIDFRHQMADIIWATRIE